jgi:hypothetical protein
VIYRRELVADNSACHDGRSDDRPDLPRRNRPNVGSSDLHRRMADRWSI